MRKDSVWVKARLPTFVFVWEAHACSFIGLLNIKFTGEVIDCYGYKGVKTLCKNHGLKPPFPVAYVKHYIFKLVLGPPNYLRNDGMPNWQRADGSDLCRGSSAAHLARADTATAREKREECVMVGLHKSIQ